MKRKTAVNYLWENVLSRMNSENWQDNKDFFIKAKEIEQNQMEDFAIWTLKQSLKNPNETKYLFDLFDKYFKDENRQD